MQSTSSVFGRGVESDILLDGQMMKRLQDCTCLRSNFDQKQWNGNWKSVKRQADYWSFQDSKKWKTEKHNSKRGLFMKLGIKQQKA